MFMQGPPDVLAMIIRASRFWKGLSFVGNQGQI